jgi:hypothetical protein
VCRHPPELIDLVAALFREPLPGNRRLVDQTPIEIADAVLDVLAPHLTSPAQPHTEPRA